MAPDDEFPESKNRERSRIAVVAVAGCLPLAAYEVDASVFNLAGARGGGDGGGEGLGVRVRFKVGDGMSS